MAYNVILHFILEPAKMRHWRFMDYHDPDGENLIRKWYEAQVPAVRAAVMWAIKEVEVTEDLEASETFNRLKRKHIGLFSLRVSAPLGTRKRQFRPVGFWSLTSGDLILVGGCEKSGRVTIPPGAYENVLDIQLRYYLDGVGTIYDHFF